jgi:hypothetical protein
MFVARAGGCSVPRRVKSFVARVVRRSIDGPMPQLLSPVPGTVTIWLADAALDSPIGRAAIPGSPSTSHRTMPIPRAMTIRLANAALKRPVRRTSIPRRMWSRIIILRACGCDYSNGDCGESSNRQGKSRFVHDGLQVAGKVSRGETAPCSLTASFAAKVLLSYSHSNLLPTAVNLKNKAGV